MKVKIFLGVLMLLFSCTESEINKENSNKKNNQKSKTEIIHDTIFKEIEKIIEVEKDYTYEELQVKLYEKEKGYDAGYNLTSGTFKSWIPLFSSNYKVTLYVENNSYISKYKDFKFKIEYVASSGTVLGSKNVTIFQTCNPQKNIEYTFTITDYPSQTVSITATKLGHSNAGRYH